MLIGMRSGVSFAARTVERIGIEYHNSKTALTVRNRTSPAVEYQFEVSRRIKEEFENGRDKQ